MIWLWVKTSSVTGNNVYALKHLRSTYFYSICLCMVDIKKIRLKRKKIDSSTFRKYSQLFSTLIYSYCFEQRSSLYCSALTLTFFPISWTLKTVRRRAIIIFCCKRIGNKCRLYNFVKFLKNVNYYLFIFQEIFILEYGIEDEDN